MKTLIALSLLMLLPLGYMLTHPLAVKDGTCIVFDGPNIMHCKGLFRSPETERWTTDTFTIVETWFLKVN